MRYLRRGNRRRAGRARFAPMARATASLAGPWRHAALHPTCGALPAPSAERPRAWLQLRGADLCDASLGFGLPPTEHDLVTSQSVEAHRRRARVGMTSHRPCNRMRRLLTSAQSWLLSRLGEPNVTIPLVYQIRSRTGNGPGSPNRKTLPLILSRIYRRAGTAPSIGRNLPGPWRRPPFRRRLRLESFVPCRRNAAALSVGCRWRATGSMVLDCGSLPALAGRGARLTTAAVKV